MRPNKYDWRAIEAAKVGVAAAIRAVPPQRRHALYNALKNNRLSDWDIQRAIGEEDMNYSSRMSLTYSLRRQCADVKQFRSEMWRKHTPVLFMEKAKDRAEHLLRMHLHSKPRANLSVSIVSGSRTRFVKMNGLTAEFTVSPGYSNFIKKIGAGFTGHTAFLRGDLLGRPFDGGEVWLVEGFDVKHLCESLVYVGVCNGIYRTASSVQRCVSAINRIATKAVFGAMEGEQQGEE